MPSTPWLPGREPPTSVWWTMLTTKPISAFSWKAGWVTKKSGKWPEPSSGSLGRLAWPGRGVGPGGAAAPWRPPRARDDLGDEGRRPPEEVDEAGPVAHQAASIDELADGVDRRHPVLRRDIDDLLTIDVGDAVAHHDDGAHPFALGPGEERVEII